MMGYSIRSFLMILKKKRSLKEIFGSHLQMKGIASNSKSTCNQLECCSLPKRPQPHISVFYQRGEQLEIPNPAFVQRGLCDKCIYYYLILNVLSKRWPKVQYLTLRFPCIMTIGNHDIWITINGQRQQYGHHYVCPVVMSNFFMQNYAIKNTSCLLLDVLTLNSVLCVDKSRTRTIVARVNFSE